LGEISSNFFESTPPNCTFSKIERCCLGVSRLGMVFFRNFEGIFEIQKQSAVGNAEVRKTPPIFIFSHILPSGYLPARKCQQSHK
jgi:hypothetical protein